MFNKQLEKYSFFKKISDVAGELDTKVYIVGGFVRDLIISEPKKDIDFLVIGSGVEFAKKLADYLNIEKVSYFKNFGTAHFRFNEYELEFVGARKESYDRNSRNPMIEEGSFEDDISRRDFTVNCLCISLNKENYGEIIDIYNGLNDLENKLIKTPIDPFITFNDDPLRILRAIRFAGTLQFDIEENAFKAAEELRDRLKIISQERITDEFLKILSSKKPSVGLKLLQKTKVMQIIFPEIANLSGIDQRKEFHHKDVFLHTCRVVDNISKNTDDVWLRFAALVHDIAKPPTKKFYEGIGWTFHGHEELGAKMMKGIFMRMRLPYHKLEYIEKLIRLHLRPIALAKEEVTDSAIRRLIVQAGEDINDLITLCRADITSQNTSKVNRYLENYNRVMTRVLEVREKDKLREFQSPVKGEEIMEICNLQPSRKVGEIKKAIEDAILDGKISNTYEEALEYLYKIKDSFLQ